MHGCQRVIDPLVADTVYIFLGAKWHGISHLFGSLVDERSLSTVKGYAFGIAFNKILIDLRPDRFEQIAHASDERKVSPH